MNKKNYQWIATFPVDTPFFKTKILKDFISKKPKFLTWLPLSHSYEHTVQFVQIVVGARIFYAESIDKLIKNMSDCSPEIMTAVPRFYQNLYQKINASFGKATGLKKKTG